MTNFKRTPYLITAIVLIAVLLITYGGWAYARVLPGISPQVTAPMTIPAKPVSLSWPTYGQAAVSATGFGQLGSSGAQTPVPMASIAKIVTALAVLKVKPLSQDQQGPTLTLGDVDVGYYQYYASNDGSVAKVASGEQISEYQALQAVLLPSSNNMADSLAYWAYGSQAQYITAANAMLAQMGLTHTHIADASGFSAETTSTASDLTSLGQTLLTSPVLSQIVSQPSANIPVAGVVNNVNSLLGTDGIIGIKTGNTDQAGGCLLFAGKKEVVTGQSVTVVGAIMGAPSLEVAMHDTIPLLDSSYGGFSTVNPIQAGQVVGYYQTAWDTKINAVATQDIKMLRWNNNKVSIKTKLSNLRAPSPKALRLGESNVTVSGNTQTSPIILQNALTAPSLYWRIRR